MPARLEEALPVESGDFLDYMELQGNLDMVTKSELLELVRKQGGRISDRQLTSYVSEGLVPKSARIGSRSGAYPRIVADLLAWIDQSRRSGLSVQAVKELIPLWRFLRRGAIKRNIDLSEFEYVARQFVTSQEAAFAIPVLFMQCVPCFLHETSDLAKIKFTTRDGRTVDASKEKVLPLSFRLGEQDPETGEIRRVARTCLALPLAAAANDDEGCITIGIPNGVEWPMTSDANEHDEEESLTMAVADEEVEQPANRRRK
jgi:DNA-binding transcriptional MerR regulator